MNEILASAPDNVNVNHNLKLDLPNDNIIVQKSNDCSKLCLPDCTAISVQNPNYICDQSLPDNLMSSSVNKFNEISELDEPKQSFLDNLVTSPADNPENGANLSFANVGLAADGNTLISKILLMTVC